MEQCPRCHERCTKHKIVLECMHVFCKSCASQMKKENKITRDGMKIWDCEINCPICERITRFKEPDMQDYMFDISFIYQDNSYFLRQVNAVELANAKIWEVKESSHLQKCGHCSEPGKKIPQSMYRQFPKCRQCKVPYQKKDLERRPPVKCPDCTFAFYCTDECLRLASTQHKRECIEIQECINVINKDRKCLKVEPRTRREQNFDGTYDIYVMKRGSSNGKVFTFRNLANREFFYMKFDLKDL